MTGLPVVMSNPNTPDVVEALRLCVLRSRWNPGAREEDRMLAATIPPEWAEVQALAQARRRCWQGFGRETGKAAIASSARPGQGTAVSCQRGREHLRLVVGREE
jgi:hypothetical protein